ncbi:hypothetical protein [Tuberibacillus sp. Marseille-P3662]|uniref:hypothetical protein n=1 Tax=Tuberibacillus sp. Marseille-P3662 TaxID=1965358 RepID=UPI000A1C967B|nr:hypothetical protein [Tuberibacillus sp. Marseille-P3662]
MGLMKAISNRNARKYEKHRSNMELLGKCPDCHGTGFHMPSHIFDDMSPDDCPHCDGSGQYTNWAENNQYR